MDEFKPLDTLLDPVTIIQLSQRNKRHTYATGSSLDSGVPFDAERPEYNEMQYSLCIIV